MNLHILEPQLLRSGYVPQVLVLNQARNARGELVWTQVLGGWAEEKRAREWCDKQVGFDPDLWIVEIEDRKGRTFVDEAIF